MDLHAVILAGGRGERFWPLSRSERPKQVLRLLGARSLLENTIERVSPAVAPERIWVIAGEAQRRAIEAAAPMLAPEQFLWEPVGRNTAPAIGAAAEWILSRSGNQDGLLLVLPADHAIPDRDRFWATIDRGRALAEEAGELVTFGIPAETPETGYGYLEAGDPIGSGTGIYRVARFHEKPDRERAETYRRRGGFFWNAGIFLFRASRIVEELRLHLPAIARPLDCLRATLPAAGVPSRDTWRDFFAGCPSISIDYAVMEKSERVAMVEAGFAWSDLGSWTSWADQVEPDRNGNRSAGSTLLLDADDNVVYSEAGGAVALLGVRNLIVVQAGGVTLVCDRERAQEIRRLVEKGRLDDELAGYF